MTEKDNRERLTPQQALQRLVEDMERVRCEFAETRDEDLLEACAFELKALEARCRYLLRRTREQDPEAQEPLLGTTNQTREKPGEETASQNVLTAQPARKSRLARLRISGTGR